MNTATGDESTSKSDRNMEIDRIGTSEYSELTDQPYTLRPSYQELLRMTGHINANIGVREIDNENKSRSELWEEELFSELGVGFPEIENYERKGVRHEK